MSLYRDFDSSHFILPNFWDDPVHFLQTFPIILTTLSFFFRSAGRIYEDENSIPENGVHIVQPPRGGCANHNLCFRSDHQWACDVGTCHQPMTQQKIADLTGKFDSKCKCKPLNTAFINQVEKLQEDVYKNASGGEYKT